MEPNHTSDEWLMARAAAGNGDALGALLRRYASSLLTFIQRMIGDRHRAEELFQEVFLAVWKRRWSYQFPRPFRPWLFGIAANQCRADFRRRVPLAMEPEDCCGQLRTAPDPSPVEAAIAAETATLVASAVAGLPPAQRTVMVLRVWNGLSYAEIAEIIGRSEGTVRSHMFHALAAVRRQLEPRLR
jgi:RNA polymerase sigma-70 factor (ECF subfamily)